MKNILPKEKGHTENKKKSRRCQIEFKSCLVMFVIKVLHTSLILNGTYLRCIKLERLHQQFFKFGKILSKYI